MTQRAKVGREKTGRWIYFAAALFALFVALWLTPDHDLNGKNVQSLAEIIAHNLTRIGFVLLVTSSVLLLLILALQNLKRGLRDASVWWTPVAVIANATIENLGKNFLDAPRPDSFQNGFPSGHSMASFLMAWLIATKYPKLAPLWYAFAVAISWSRVEIHAHFPYQVLGGAFIGTLIGWAITRFFPSAVSTSKIVADEV